MTNPKLDNQTPTDYAPIAVTISNPEAIRPPEVEPEVSIRLDTRAYTFPVAAGLNGPVAFNGNMVVQVGAKNWRRSRFLLATPVANTAPVLISDNQSGLQPETFGIPAGTTIELKSCHELFAIGAANDILYVLEESYGSA